MSRAAQAIQFMQKAAAGDPSFSSVKLLCHFDGTNGSTTFVDSSSVANNPGAGAGTTTLSTTSPQFGTACLSATGGGASAAITATNAAYAIGTGDFTWEFSYFTANPSAVYNLCDYGNGGTHPATAFVIYTSGSSYHFYVNADKVVGGTIPTSTWQAVAYSRNSGTGRLLVGGVSVGTWADNINYTNGGLFMAGYGGNSSGPVAKFDEWRFTVGVGRYTGNYTPATAAFPNN